MSERATQPAMILPGDENNREQELSQANVNHLRRLLGWLVCEYNLSDEGQRGMLTGLDMAVRAGADIARAQQVLDDEVERIRHVPYYIRQAVKQLRKAIREHEQKTKVIAHD